MHGKQIARPQAELENTEGMSAKRRQTQSVVVSKKRPPRSARANSFRDSSGNGLQRENDGLYLLIARCTCIRNGKEQNARPKVSCVE